jgi:hypothetical protein
MVGLIFVNLNLLNAILISLFMKANLYLIALSLVVLPTIYFINGEKSHWTQLIPLGYLVYGFIVGTISAFRKK